MATKYIVGSVLASFAVAYVCDVVIADKKVFGGKYKLFIGLLQFSNWLCLQALMSFHTGTTPHTVANNEWWKETDKKFQAWPRTAGPPVVMNPISRQNYIVKS